MARHPLTHIGLRLRISSASLQYFSRFVAAIFNRLCGIPHICIFDDLAARLPRIVASKGLAVFTRFFDLLGIRLKSAKSEVGPDVIFLGLLGKFPAIGTDFALRISLPGEKEKARPDLNLSYLAHSRISFHELEMLIGRLSFAQILLFGVFARTQLPPIYQNLYRGIHCRPIGGRESNLLSDV